MYLSTSIDVNLTSPMAKGVNALEIWMLCCMLMVFAALSEYGLILLIKFIKNIPLEKINHRLKSASVITNYGLDLNLHNSNRNDTDDGNNPSAHEEDGDVNVEQDTRNLNGVLLVLQKVDFVSMIIFPIVFFLFLFLYYSYYSFYWVSFKQ